jgi:hypothetical protein
MNPIEWIRESWLGRRLGLNRDEMRELRVNHLKEGEDYTLVKNRIHISPTGEKKLRDHLNLPVQTSGVAPQAPNAVKQTPPIELKNTAPGSDAERIETLLVWRANLPNRRIVEAYKPGTDPAERANILRVKVKDADRFSRFDNTGQPMKILAVHLQVDLYEHIGPQPKRKGRY